MHHGHRGPEEKLGNKVAVTYAVHTVVGDVIEAQISGNGLAIDTKGIASQCATA